MEANLIDRDVAEDYFGCSDWEILAKETLREVPLVDAVPVVRCINCKYKGVLWRETICDHPNGMLHKVKPDDFCSYGKRKEAKLFEQREGDQHGQTENLRGAGG
ncbi:Uncharacterised protein [uncultured Clostridium sp.]|nr:Uncharacterised protein [uncultured Clostridium sp.]